MKYLIIITLLSACYVCPDGNYVLDYKEGCKEDEQEAGTGVSEPPPEVGTGKPAEFEEVPPKVVLPVEVCARIAFEEGLAEPLLTYSPVGLPLNGPAVGIMTWDAVGDDIFAGTGWQWLYAVPKAGLPALLYPPKGTELWLYQPPPPDPSVYAWTFSNHLATAYVEGSITQHINVEKTVRLHYTHFIGDPAGVWWNFLGDSALYGNTGIPASSVGLTQATAETALSGYMGFQAYAGYCVFGEGQ